MAKKHNTGNELVSLDDPKSLITEAYRTLRTNIQFSSLDEPLRRLLVTSAEPGEGKSTVSANLGLIMAQVGHKVILVDCDLRRPTLHKKFSLSNFKGLTNCLVENLPLESTLQKTKADNLKVLTSGPLPPNPAEILSSQKMKNLLEELSQLADLVIIDTPPLIAVTDAAILAAESDGVVLSVEAAKTKMDTAKHAVKLLRNVNARILGTVLNKADVTKHSYYYYYYYYGEGEGKKG